MLPIKSLMIFSSILLTLNAAEPPKPPLFQMRLVQEKPTADSERLTMMRSDRAASEVLNVSKVPVLDQTNIKSARFQKSPTGQPEVGVTFTEQGRKAFADVTRTNIDKRLAIVIEGKLVSAPIIRTEIPGGKAVIQGDFSAAEAKDLWDPLESTCRHASLSIL